MMERRKSSFASYCSDERGRGSPHLTSERGSVAEELESVPLEFFLENVGFFKFMLPSSTTRILTALGSLSLTQASTLRTLNSR